jgi:hypothetical protein
MPTEAARDTVVLRSSRREQRLSRRSAGLERRGRDSNPRTEVIRLRILRREQTLQSACKYACFLVRRYGGGYGWATGAPRLPPRGRPRQRGRSSPRAREHESTRAREHESKDRELPRFDGPFVHRLDGGLHQRPHAFKLGSHRRVGRRGEGRHADSLSFCSREPEGVNR